MIRTCITTFRNHILNNYATGAIGLIKQFTDHFLVRLGAIHACTTLYMARDGLGIGILGVVSINILYNMGPQKSTTELTFDLPVVWFLVTFFLIFQ